MEENKVGELKNPFGRQLLTPAEAGWALGLTRKTILGWMGQGKFTFYGTYRKRWLDWNELVEVIKNPPPNRHRGPKIGTGGRPRKNGPGKPARSTRQEISLLDAAIAGLREEARRKDALAKQVARDGALAKVDQVVR